MGNVNCANRIISHLFKDSCGIILFHGVANLGMLNLMGNWFVALQCKTILYCVSVCRNEYLCLRVAHKIQEH